MTSKERIERALAGQDVDYVPFCPFLAYVWEFFPQDIQEMGQLAFHKLVGADPLWRGAPCPVKAIPPPQMGTGTMDANDRTITEIRTPVGCLTMAHQKSATGNTLFLTEHPLKTEEDYKVQMWIEEHTRFERESPRVEQHFANNGREGLSLGMLIPRMKTAYQTLVEVFAGTEELIYALADFPETVEALWQTMMEKNREAVQIALDSPYEMFITWEDSSTQNYSPAQYDRYIGPEIAEWCRLLSSRNKHYVQHACGHTKDLVARMKACGVYAVESLSPPPTGNLPLRQAREIVGAGMGIIGGIEPTNFLKLPPDQLTAYVEQTLADGAGGPFVLANSDSCPPGVTVEKFRQVAETTRARKSRA